MNYVSLSAQCVEEPHEFYVGETMTNWSVKVMLPPTSQKKAATPLTLTATTRACKEQVSKVRTGDRLYIHAGQLRHNVDIQEHSLQNGNIIQVTDAFPILNSVILSGKCLKAPKDDPRSYRVLDSGLIICEQSLAVGVAKGNNEIFNVRAYSAPEDRYKPAEVMANYTRYGSGLTVMGKLTTDMYKDRETGEPKHKTKIDVSRLTLGPKQQPAEPKPIEPQASLAGDVQPASLWGGKTAADDELPELPMPI